MLHSLDWAALILEQAVALEMQARLKATPEPPPPPPPPPKPKISFGFSDDEEEPAPLMRSPTVRIMEEVQYDDDRGVDPEELPPCGCLFMMVRPAQDAGLRPGIQIGLHS